MLRSTKKTKNDVIEATHDLPRQDAKDRLGLKSSSPLNLAQEAAIHTHCNRPIHWKDQPRPELTAAQD
jgi:hypothetical protein